MSDNPHPMRDINYGDFARFLAQHGYDHGVIIATKEGNDGGQCVANAGITYRSGEISSSMAAFIKSNLLGWRPDEEAAALDKMIAEAKREMATGPDGNPELGSTLIRTDVAKRDRR